MLRDYGGAIAANTASTLDIVPDKSLIERVKGLLESTDRAVARIAKGLACKIHAQAADTSVSLDICSDRSV